MRKVPFCYTQLLQVPRDKCIRRFFFCSCQLVILAQRRIKERVDKELRENIFLIGFQFGEGRWVARARASSL